MTSPASVASSGLTRRLGLFDGLGTMLGTGVFAAFGPAAAAAGAGLLIALAVAYCNGTGPAQLALDSREHLVQQFADSVTHVAVPTPPIRKPCSSSTSRTSTAPWWPSATSWRPAS